MANLKHAKKKAKQDEAKKLKNLARKTAVKTAIKKVLLAIEQGEKAAVTRELLKEAEAKIARASGKHLFHKNTASRKIGRLAHRVALAEKAATK